MKCSVEMGERITRIREGFRDLQRRAGVSAFNAFAPIRELDSFLSENQALFTIVGVFTAVSVYLHNLDTEKFPTGARKFAVFTGFGIVLICSVVLLYKLKRQATAKGRYIGAYRNAGLAVFLLFFLQLLAIISIIISSFQTILTPYIFFVVYTVGLVVGASYFVVGIRLAEFLTNISQWLKYVVIIVVWVLPFVAAVKWTESPYYLTNLESIGPGAPMISWLSFGATLAIGFAILVSGVSTSLFILGILLIAVVDTFISGMLLLAKYWPLRNRLSQETIDKLEGTRDSLPFTDSSESGDP